MALKASIFCWAWSEPFGSDLTSLWMHLSVSISSCKAMLFHSSSDSLLTLLGGGISASLCMVFLCFSCSVFISGLFFQQVCFLTGLLSNCSIALFIISWNSSMNSILSVLWLTSDKLSLSLNSSTSLSWSRGGLFACHTFPVLLPNIPVSSHLSVDRHLRIWSLLFSGSFSTHLSSITASVISLMLCTSGISSVGFLTVLASLPVALSSSSSSLCSQLAAIDWYITNAANVFWNTF